MTPALLFDFGGTLDADGIAWKERFAALFRDEGVAAPGEGFDRAFYDADDALVGAVPKELSFEETVARLSEGVAERLSARAGAGSRVAARFLSDARAKLAENARLLAQLAPKFRLGVVSNFYGNLEAVCAGTGLTPHLSVAVDSSAVGFEKPDPRIFEAALSALGATPESAIFVGDSLPRDMEGARRLGMRHVWLKPGQSRACCPGDAVIASLSQLPDVLP